MTPEDVYTYYGGGTAAARALGIGRSAVDNWKTRGAVPIKHQLIIEKKTNGKLKASLDDLKIGDK